MCIVRDLFASSVAECICDSTYLFSEHLVMFEFLRLFSIFDWVEMKAFYTYNLMVQNFCERTSRLFLVDHKNMTFSEIL
jgi:hypothetical protein